VRYSSLLLGLTVALFVTWVPSAFAHSVLERSIPAANAVLQSAPDQITLWFSEPVDPVLSRAVVTGAGGARRGGPSAVSRDGRQVTLAVGTLPRGVYTVAWHVLSTSDGHIATGSFAFAVGTLLPDGTAPARVAMPEPARVVSRWLTLMATILLAGSVLFRTVVVRPTLRRLASAEAHRLSGPSGRALARVSRVAAVGLLLGLALELGINIAVLSAGPGLMAATRGAEAILTGTKLGWSLLIRGGLAVMLLVLAAARDRRASEPVAALAAAALPAGLTLASHASGAGIGAAVADWLHALAACVWIGGLAGLLVVLRAASGGDRSLLSRALVPRFSTVAAGGFGVVLLTGTLGVWFHASDVAAALATPYGRTLAVKVVLVAVLVGLGALSRFIVRPRLAGDTGTGTLLQGFLRLSNSEVVVGAVILLVVAMLSLTPPATSVVPATRPSVTLLAGIAGDLTVQLAITPAAPGWNRLEVAARGQDGAPVAAPARVLVRLLKLDEARDPTTVHLPVVAAGRFAAEGGDLAAPGWWEVEVVVRRAGRLDVAAIFPLMLEPARECRPAPGLAAPDAEAVMLVSEARQAWARVRTWRETQQLTDGAGNVYLTWVEAERPDRQHFRTSTGVEVVALGAVRYQRSSGGPWQRYEFAAPVPVEGPIYFLRGAQAVSLGRTGQCSGEPCRVLFWTSPDGGARFAAWVGANTARVHRLLMLEPTHYMTLQYSGVDAPVRIREPR
jgi:copper transport protein